MELYYRLTPQPIENYVIQVVDGSWPTLVFPSNDPSPKSKPPIVRPADFEPINRLVAFPNDTQWSMTMVDGLSKKWTPDCSCCIIQPGVRHSTPGHCAIFQNATNMIKSCFSHGSQVVDKKEARKLEKLFNIVLNVKEDTSLFEGLYNDMCDTAFQEGLRREKETGVIFRPINGCSYAYERCYAPKDFLRKIFLEDRDFKSNVSNIDKLDKFLKEINDSRFLFIEYSSDHIGFKNGVLVLSTAQFIESHEFKESIVVRKYIPHDFTGSMETPLMDKVLLYQFPPDVVEFIYMSIGRLFGRRDNWGYMLYLMGEAGCGKSLLIEVVSQLFASIGSIASNFEDKFGMSYLYDKDLIVCDDLPKNIGKVFHQQLFQTCVTGGQVPIAVKGGDGFNVAWQPHFLWAGNYHIDYLDKGQISRRVATCLFEKMVEHAETDLFDRIVSSELGALLLSKYNDALLKHRSPEYFQGVLYLN